MKKIKSKNVDTVIIPVEKEVKNLLEMFEFFLTERQLNKPIEMLGESVRDMRIIIGRILVDYFLGLKSEEEIKFCRSLAMMLADRCVDIPLDEKDDGIYQDYCIGEILTAFEYAQEIKVKYPDDPILQKILALDIPVLRPFDYGLRGKIKLVDKKKKRAHYEI